MNITKEQNEILDDLSMSTNPKVSYETNEFINFNSFNKRTITRAYPNHKPKT